MNIRDIARLANVTPGTVSKVLNNYPDISEATRQHVLQIIKENQYTTKNGGRKFKQAVTPRIGLVSENVYNWVSETMQNLLSVRFHNADYTVLSFQDNYFSQNKNEKFQELLTYIDRHQLIGLIYFGGNFEDVPADSFAALNCPVIFVNTVLPPDNMMTATTYSSVQGNHYETAYWQMESLIKNGHSHICMLISSKIDISVYRLRWQAYEDALSSHGLSTEYLAESDYQCERAYRELTEVLTMHPEITAICSISDIVTPAAIRAIHDLGKIPGKDVHIISFDGMPSMHYCIPSISTFIQPRDEMAGYIYDLLLGLISDERQHQHITFQTRFSPGESE